MEPVKDINEALSLLAGIANILDSIELKGSQNCFKLWLCCRDLNRVRDFVGGMENGIKNAKSEPDKTGTK